MSQKDYTTKKEKIQAFNERKTGADRNFAATRRAKGRNCERNRNCAVDPVQRAKTRYGGTNG